MGRGVANTLLSGKKITIKEKRKHFNPIVSIRRMSEKNGRFWAKNHLFSRISEGKRRPSCANRRFGCCLFSLSDSPTRRVGESPTSRVSRGVVDSPSRGVTDSPSRGVLLCVRRLFSRYSFKDSPLSYRILTFYFLL